MNTKRDFISITNFCSFALQASIQLVQITFVIFTFTFVGIKIARVQLGKNFLIKIQRRRHTHSHTSKFQAQLRPPKLILLLLQVHICSFQYLPETGANYRDRNGRKRELKPSTLVFCVLCVSSRAIQVINLIFEIVSMQRHQQHCDHDLI